MVSEPEDWIKSLDCIPLKRYNMNRLIMDYLVAEGFKEAAEKFKHEAGIDTTKKIDNGHSSKFGSSLSSSNLSYEDQQLEERISIREAIEDGKIEYSLFLINQLYAELIDQNRALYFKIQQQQLIELIRERRVEEALDFAQEQLCVDEEYLQLLELERTLALLAFDKPECSPYSDLLEIQHRQQLASEVNEAIIKEQTGAAETTKPHIVTLIKLLMSTQNDLDKKRSKYHKMTDIANAKFASS